MIMKYRALLTAAECGTIAEAAEKLGYTVSGISRMISSLEEELAMTLLLRRKSGVTPTAECIEMMPHFRSILNAYEGMKQSADQLHGLITGDISAGTSMESYIPQLARITGEFKEMYPGIHVNILQDYSSPLAELLQEGKADFCIMSRRPGHFRWHPLKTDRLVVLVPPGHRFEQMESVPLEMLEEETFIEIQTSIDTDNALMFRKNGIKLPRSLSCSSNFAAASMIEAGLGITIENEVNAKVWNKNLPAVPLDPPQPVEIGIGYPDKENMSPAAERFIEFALASVVK